MKENIFNSRETPLENLQGTVLQRLKNVTKPIIVFSDLDETLTNNYNFDPETNNHIPVLSQEMVDLISPRRRLIIATARLADDPVISDIHRQLQMPSFIPIIAEDGGVLVFPFRKKLLGPEPIPQALDDIHQQLIKNLPVLNHHEIFVFKGLTMLKIRAQDVNGHGNPDTHSTLAEILVNQIPGDIFEIQTTGSSVTIKPKGVTKALGLKEVFSWLTHLFNHVSWENSFILGLGDNQNDQSIFSRSDLSISVGKQPFNSDIFCPHGEKASLEVIKAFIKHSAK